MKTVITHIISTCHKRAMALLVAFLSIFTLVAQINTDQVLKIGKNALYFEDYVLSIQYFNQVIMAKPYLAEPYYYRAIAKISLDDYRGAEEDAALCIERNPFIVDAYQVRGVARQSQDKFNEAIEDYKSGLKLSPYDKAQLLNLASCQIEVGALNEADTTLQLLQRIDSKNDKVYLTLAHLALERGDTTAAVSCASQSLSLNSNNLQAHLMLAHVAMKTDSLQLALNHLDEAIKLESRQADFFVNRAYLKYKLDDYYGAMADFDYAITLEPSNTAAIYNRAMLNAEVAEDSKAIEGFTRVLELEPDNFLALYNRAILLMKTGQYKRAVGDFSQVLERYPRFEGGFMMRSEARRRSGDIAGSEKDMNYAVALMKKKGVHRSDYNPARIENEKMAQRANQQSDSVEVETEDDIMNRFNELMTVAVDDTYKPEYSNRSRGRVQNSRMEIEPEPFFLVSYYTPADNDISTVGSTHYMAEITALNELRQLPMILTLANHDVQLSSEDINRHFSSIEYYNGLIAQATSRRAIDYLARALDLLTVKNVDAAITDLNIAIELSPSEPIVYFCRACAYYRSFQMARQVAPNDERGDIDPQVAQQLREHEIAKYLEMAMDDINKTIKLSPRNAYAQYDLGVLYMETQNLTAAIAAFSAALELKPSFGEAYYNRGMLYLKMGNKSAGVADLSKAGELGILPSYTVLKHFR